LGSLRICISSFAFLPILLYHFKKVDWKKWHLFVLVGLTGSGIPAFLYAIAQTEISSSISGLLNSLTPIWTLILGLVFFKAVLRDSQVVGSILGFSGAAMLLILSQGVDLSGNIIFGLFVVAGTLCYGTSVNIVKKYFQNTRSLIMSAVSFVLIGPPALLYLMMTDVPSKVVTHPYGWWSLSAVFFLSLIGTVLASIIFYKLVQTTNPVFASSVAYIMPIVAIGWGLLDGEYISWRHLLGMAMILTGVYLIKSDFNMGIFRSKVKLDE